MSWVSESYTAAPWAVCQVCGWEYAHSDEARARAKAHARGYVGHRVSVVKEVTADYMWEED